MLNKIGSFVFTLFLSLTASQATLLVDTPEDKEAQAKVIQCLRQKSFPNIPLTDQATIDQLTKHFSNFSNGTLTKTPESTFVKSQLETEGVLCSVIQIPSTVYDLEVIYRFFTDKAFEKEAFENSESGGKNHVGIKNSSIVDERFLSISKELFPIFQSFEKEDDFLNHARKLMEHILSLQETTDASRFVETKQYLSEFQHLILATISHELQSQKEGKINFYRATAGIEYDDNRTSDELMMTQHSKGKDSVEQDISFLYGFFCGSGVNSMQGICDGRYPPLPLDSTLEQILAFEKTYKNNNWFWGPELSKAAQNVSGKGMIVDYPFYHNPGEANEYNLHFKELSYSYSLLGGFIYDGVLAQQSACSFIYIAKNSNKYPYYYALSYKLPDFYNKFSSCFKISQTPLYQCVLDSGEAFHPRFQLQTKGDVQAELADFYDHIKILGLYGEDASTIENTPFVQSLENRHRKLHGYIPVRYKFGLDGNDRPWEFESSGLSGHEPTHRWTEGEDKKAVFTIPHINPHTGNRVREIIFENVGALRPQTVNVLFNNMIDQSIEYTAQNIQQSISVQFPTDLIQDAVITFLIPSACKPGEIFPENADPRILGLAFSTALVR